MSDIHSEMRELWDDAMTTRPYLLLLRREIECFRCWMKVRLNINRETEVRCGEWSRSVTCYSGIFLTGPPSTYSYDELECCGCSAYGIALIRLAPNDTMTNRATSCSGGCSQVLYLQALDRTSAPERTGILPELYGDHILTFRVRIRDSGYSWNVSCSTDLRTRTDGNGHCRPAAEQLSSWKPGRISVFLIRWR